VGPIRKMPKGGPFRETQENRSREKPKESSLFGFRNK
jgi:hypothetical protein